MSVVNGFWTWSESMGAAAPDLKSRAARFLMSAPVSSFLGTSSLRIVSA